MLDLLCICVHHSMSGPGLVHQTTLPVQVSANFIEHIFYYFCPQIVVIFIKNDEFDKAEKVLNKHFLKAMVGKVSLATNATCSFINAIISKSQISI